MAAVGVAWVFLAQILLVVVSAAVAFFGFDGPQALAVAGGGVIALVNTALLHFSLKWSSPTSPSGSTPLFLGVVLRFGWTLLGMALLMGAARLNPLAVLGGFAVAQLGYAIAAGFSYRGADEPGVAAHKATERQSGDGSD